MAGMIEAEEMPEYQAFVDKFKPKKTTDDCYTPEGVYNAVRDWVFEEYALPSDTQVIRPFWPGGDYENEQYPEGCIVIDNPPFSILSKIKRWFDEHGVRYFLFAPGLTLFSNVLKSGCAIVIKADITYENGARIGTGFITNLEPDTAFRTAPKLQHAIEEAQKTDGKKLPAYAYSHAIATAANVQRISEFDYRVKRSEVYAIRKADNSPPGKALFGGGFIISERAAAERAAAERAAAERAAA
ncbi:MAG: chromosome partitioning protein ParB, partial [Bacteroidales bacterium]|nr:chromosome partitioning protein ParB [Bacteroidales bacterium]